MANQPIVNRGSLLLIKKATPGTLLTGYGVVFTGGTTRCRPVAAPNTEHASVIVMEIGS